MTLRLLRYPCPLLCSILLIIVFVSCTAQPRTMIGKAENVSSPTAPRIEEEIFQLVNQHRLAKDLPALQINNLISEQSLTHSKNMASKKVDFSHDGFEDRVQNINTKIGGSKRSAENVAYGKISAREVVDFWLKSPGHRKNIEGNYTHTGIGIARAADGTIFFTQIFIQK